jgi:transcriptional regulator with XRE-family HTH domain
MELTPLQQWLKLNDESIAGLARILQVSRGRAQFWVCRATMPRGQMLDNLMTLTGLSVRELIPDPTQQERRRLREERRRHEVRNGVKAKPPGRPKKTWIMVKGKLTEVKPRGKRADRH